MSEKSEQNFASRDTMLIERHSTDSGDRHTGMAVRSGWLHPERSLTIASVSGSIPPADRLGVARMRQAR